MPDEIAAALPLTAGDALKVWDSGAPLQAFRVESEGATQDAIYAAAFDWIDDAQPNRSELHASGETLTARELDAAFSIAIVAGKNGWARMVLDHIHSNSPAITIRRPQGE